MSRVASVSARGRFDEEPLRPSPKHRCGAALPFRGVTLMTPMGRLDQSARALYDHLERVSTSLCAARSDSLIQVDPLLYHVTGSDLIAGERYDLLSEERGDSLHDKLLGHLRRLQDELYPERSLKSSPREPQHILMWSWAGVALLRTALVALFVPRSTKVYQQLHSWRQLIYQDRKLNDLGVRPPLPLLLHVTLAYYSEQISAQTSDGLADFQRRIGVINQGLEIKEMSLSLDVSSLQLHSFEDMNTFTAIGSRDQQVVL